MMLPKALQRTLMFIGAVLFLSAGPALADDKKDEKAKPLTGAWQKKGGDLKIEFADKGMLKIYPHGDKADISVVCTYSVDKDGLVKAKITEIAASEENKAKAKNAIPIGLEFTFKYAVKDDVATLDDMKAENAETLKSHLEGEYEKK